MWNRDRVVWPVVALVTVLQAAGLACAGDSDRGDGAGEVGDQQLRRELLDMQEADQAERTGEPVEGWDDVGRPSGWPRSSTSAAGPPVSS